MRQVGVGCWTLEPRVALASQERVITAASVRRNYRCSTINCTNAGNISCSPSSYDVLILVTSTDDLICVCFSTRNLVLRLDEPIFAFKFEYKLLDCSSCQV